MKPSGLLVAIAALSLPLLAGCVAPSQQSGAEDLLDRLAALAGVSAATLDYREPVFMDSGKLALRVEMSDDADPRQVHNVVSTTYAAFAGAHRSEEGDLDVVVGDDVIHLRSFEPDAEVAAVEKAAANAITVLSSGSVRADINTQDVSGSSHVFTHFAVAVEEPGRDSVVAKLTDLETAHRDLPEAGWRVQSGGEKGWLISADIGFPDATQLAIFDDLSADLPAGAVVLLYDRFATVQVPGSTSPADVSDLVGRHLALLGGVQEALYNVESGSSLFAAITYGECFFDTGAVGARLEQDFKADCSVVTHPEP